MFSQSTEKYAYPTYPWQQDDTGFYFPDAAIDPFIKQAQAVAGQIFKAHLAAGDTLSPINRHRLLITDPRLTWEESCDLAVSAFKEFNSHLGMKARQVISDPRRWRLNAASLGEAAGCCHPANCETNSNPFAIIEYQYDGTINDAVYIAHELGHLIADDFLNESGFSYQSSKRHMAEVQAFFTQHILYDYLSRHPRTELAHAGKNHFVGEITRSLYAIPIAIGALESEKSALSGKPETEIGCSYEAVVHGWLGDKWREYSKAQRLSDQILNPRKRDEWGICDLHQHSMAAIIAAGLFFHSRDRNPDQRGAMISSLFGKEGPKHINDILEETGIRTSDELESVARVAMDNISQPLRRPSIANSSRNLPGIGRDRAGKSDNILIIS